MPADKKYDLFLSYGRKDDLPFTKQLHADLTQQGYHAWFDAKDLESNGLSFLQSIRDSIATNPIRLLLVIGPHAAKSEYVRFEWEFALANCMIIIPLLRMGPEKDKNGVPVKSDKDYDLIPGPLKKRKLDCIDFRSERPYADALKELLQDLSGPVLPLCDLYSVPNKPANFIARNNEVDKIKEIVMGDNYTPGVITSVGKSTAVQGMGGIGKSVLATSICHDCDVRRSFADGVYWITIGQQQPEINITKAIQLLTGDYTLNLRDNTDDAKNKLRTSLQQKNCLLVLDDVWQQTDIEVFPSDEALRCRLLITTRNKQTVQHLTSKIVEVGLLNNDDARSLLAKAATGANEIKKYTAATLPQEADAIIEECGNLPLAIDMAGGMISAGDAQRWKDVLEALQEADLAYFEQQFPDYPYPNLFKVLDVSIVLLEASQKNRYMQLAVFPMDAILPGKIIHILWKEGKEAERKTNKLLDEFVARSLIQRTSDGLYTLHDLQVDYLKTTCGNLQELNKKFVAKLGDPLQLTDEYAWNNYIWHLKEAGETAAAIRLLQRFEWIQAKLFATDINELLRDYEHLHLDEETDLIYRTLTQAAHIFAPGNFEGLHKGHLAAQLIARLPPGSKIINQLLKSAADCLIPAQQILWPLTSSLQTPPSLIRSLMSSKDWVNALVTLPDGRLAAASGDKTIKIWNTETGEVELTLKGHSSSVWSLILLSDGRLASGSGREDTNVWNSGAEPAVFEIKIWNLETGKNEVTFTGNNRESMGGHTNTIISLLQIDRQRLLSAAGDYVRIWDLSGNEDQQSIEYDVFGSSYLKLPDGSVVFMEWGSMKLLDTGTGETTMITDEYHGTTIVPLVLLPDNQLALGRHDLSIGIYDLAGKINKVLPGHSSWASALLSLPGNRLVSGSKDGSIKIWDLVTGMAISTLEGHSTRVSSLSLLPGDRFASASWDGAIKIWDLAGKEELAIDKHERTIRALAFLPDNKIASGSDDGVIKTWDRRTLKSDLTFKEHTKSVRSLVLLDDGRLLSASWDENIIVRSLSIGIPQIINHGCKINDVLVLPDQKVACAVEDEHIRIADLPTGEIAALNEGHNSAYILSLALMPDGDLISGAAGGEIKSWDITTWTSKLSFKGHDSDVSVLLPLPDGGFASGSWHGVIKIWNVDSEDEQAILYGHNETIWALAPLPDGKIASGSRDRTIRIWTKEKNEWSSSIAFIMDAGVTALAFDETNDVLFAGDATGRMHFLKLNHH